MCKGKSEIKKKKIPNPIHNPSWIGEPLLNSNFNLIRSWFKHLGQTLGHNSLSNLCPVLLCVLFLQVFKTLLTLQFSSTSLFLFRHLFHLFNTFFYLFCFFPFFLSSASLLFLSLLSGQCPRPDPKLILSFPVLRSREEQPTSRVLYHCYVLLLFL